jgi:hypothetical protein
MPARDLQKFGHLVGPHVEPEERVLDIASVQSARASVGVMLGLAGAAGLAIVDRAAVKAGTGNLAKTFLSGSRPPQRSCSAWPTGDSSSSWLGRIEKGLNWRGRRLCLR